MKEVFYRCANGTQSIYYFRICLSLEDVTMCADHEVLMEVDNNSVPIVDDQQGILR
jgi:hypothetical protein